MDYGSDVAPEHSLGEEAGRERRVGGRRGQEGWRKGRVKMGRAVSVIAERRADSVVVTLVCSSRRTVEWAEEEEETERKRERKREERQRAEEEEDEIGRRGELTFSCAGKVRQSLTDRLT